MGTVEAIDEVLAFASTLKFKDYFGEIPEPEIVLAAVSNFHGERWSALETRFFGQEILPEEYVQVAKDMIVEYEGYRVRWALEKKLIALRGESA